MSGIQSKLPPWSYSMLEKFENCPKSALHKYILKEKEPESEAQRRGNAVHKALEARINGTPLPETMLSYAPMAASIVNAGQRGMKVYAELKMGLRRDMTACGFFDKDVWGRSAADVVLKQGDKAILFDWKTGKKREKDMQHFIMALFIFKHFPAVNRITGINLWLETNEVGTPYAFAREQEPLMWQKVLLKIQAMEKALEKMDWPAVRNPLCAYCPVTTCEHNGGRNVQGR